MRAGKPISRPVFGNAITPSMEKIKLPCGQCVGCRLDHSLMWATRATHEARSHEDNSFITLTYSDEHFPQDLSLSKDHITRFLKRLRKRLSPQKIKYFQCGEYSPKRTPLIGPTNVHPDTIPEGQRPHYHALIFGYDFPDKELWTVRDDIPTYTSDLLSSIWGKGFCTVGALTFESAAYVARYSLKKINGPLEQKPDEKTGLRVYERVHPHTFEILEVEKEFVSMSNGIGKDHYLNYTLDMYPRDTVVINGFDRRPPRYYDDLYDQEQPDLMEEIRQKRVERMHTHRKDNTPQRLEQREKVKMAQLNQLKREAI